MTPDIKELLPLYALGILDADEERAVEAAVARDPALAAELASYRDAATAMIAPETPSADVKTRLLASIGAGRFERFSTAMGRLFDVTVDRAREILGLADRTASWELPMPGVGLVHFDGGPACAAADCGFIRLADGAVFPPHTHRGEEVSLILFTRGSLRSIAKDGTERMLHAGEELVLPQGSEHHLIAVGECIFAARAMNGIEIGGVPMTTPRSGR